MQNFLNINVHFHEVNRCQDPEVEYDAKRKKEKNYAFSLEFQR
jgi:hypothetical protein